MFCACCSLFNEHHLTSGKKIRSDPILVDISLTAFLSNLLIQVTELSRLDESLAPVIQRVQYSPRTLYRKFVLWEAHCTETSFMFFFLIRKQNPTAQEKDNQWSPLSKHQKRWTWKLIMLSRLTEWNRIPITNHQCHFIAGLWPPKSYNKIPLFVSSWWTKWHEESHSGGVLQIWQQPSPLVQSLLALPRIMGQHLYCWWVVSPGTR